MNDSPMIRSTVLFAFALVAQACGAMVTPVGDASTRSDASTSSDANARDAARTCTSNADCAGALCDGPPGCGVPWTCVPSRECDTIAVPFCACDGVTTFISSPGCVGRPFAHQGPCEGPPPPDAGVDAGGSCTEVPSDEIRIASALYCDQTLDVTLHQTAGPGCGCTVTAVEASGTLTGELSVCNCCDLCDCIDGVVEASVSHPPTPCAGMPIEQRVAGRSVWIVPPPTSAPATLIPTITSAMVVAPRSTSGPALWWVHLQGTVQRCASSGTLVCVRDQRMPATGETQLDLFASDCSMFDCDGPVHAEPFDTWHSLGELSPGAYRLAVPGLMDTLFSVPGMR